MEGWIKSKKILHVRKTLEATGKLCQLPSSSPPTWTPGHILTFLSLNLSWQPFTQTLPFMPRTRHFPYTVNPVLSQVCSHITQNRMRGTTQEVNPRRRNCSPGFLLSGYIGRNTHVQPNHRWGVLRIAGVCLSVEMYANFKPHAHTARIHNSHMPHTIRLVFDDY